jgi:tRNA pseudouridine synthase 10
MMLCRACSMRFRHKFSIGNCHICGNRMDNAEKAIAGYDFNGIGAKGVKKFSVSSIIGKKTLAVEEDVFDVCLGETVKRQLNRIMRETIERKTGLEYNPDYPDVSFCFNLETGAMSHKMEPLFIFGRYKKLEPNVAQKEWFVKRFPSLEGIIGEKMKEAAEAHSFTMHASGREDIDVTNTAGRPFVMEIRGAKARDTGLKDMENEINSDKRVKVKLIGYVNPSFVALISDSHFDKGYRAYFSSEESIDEKDLETIRKLEGITISQRTPERVINRRADLTRKRKIHSLEVGKDGKGFYAEIGCEAGMYIKELINGDNGRTEPNFSTATHKNIRCDSLVVTRIRDRFLDTVKP